MNNNSITIHRFQREIWKGDLIFDVFFYHVFNEDKTLSIVFDKQGVKYNPSLVDYDKLGKVELVYFAQLPPVIRVQIIQETIEVMLNKQDQVMNEIRQLFRCLKEEQSQLQ